METTEELNDRNRGKYLVKPMQMLSFLITGPACKNKWNWFSFKRKKKNVIIKISVGENQLQKPFKY